MSVLHSYIGPICYDIMHIYFIYVFGEKNRAGGADAEWQDTVTSNFCPRRSHNVLWEEFRGAIVYKVRYRQLLISDTHIVIQPFSVRFKLLFLLNKGTKTLICWHIVRKLRDTDAFVLYTLN